MANSSTQHELFSSTMGADQTIVVNERCVIRTKDHQRIVVVVGMPLAHYAVGDRMAEVYAMICLVERGWANQADVAKALGYTARSLRRYQRRFEEGGLAALGRSGGYPKGRSRVAASRLRHLQQLKSQGLSNRQIAHRLGVTENAIRKLLRRLGWTKAKDTQLDLPLSPETADPGRSTGEKPSPRAARGSHADAAHPNLSAFATEDPPPTLDRDPMNRRVDRFFAFLGLLDDAAPLFESRDRVPHVGLLLVIPCLLSSGVLEAARRIYGPIGPAFYGLRTTIVTLLLMALLRIKRPEGLKERAPQDLGRVLGLDRAPEVKTVRRKLTRLAAVGRATDFGRALAAHRVTERGEALGFLYVDGHVRVYHGRNTLPKAHVARMRLSMPATTDYWVNDREGEPLFVLTAEANDGLCSMLPPILAEVRGLVGERRVTIVFDRGGWSPRLFQKILAEGFDLLTYRKGRFRRLARRQFREHVARIARRRVSYRLADGGIRLLNGALQLRQVTRLSPNGHQTPIITSRRDLSAAVVAYRMFERWRQENFFKYLREEYALDTLVDYRVEAADPQRDVPNPVRRQLDQRIRDAWERLERLEAQYGSDALLNEESRHRTMRGFKIAHAGKSAEIDEVFEELMRLRSRRAKAPARVPVMDVTDGPVVKLATERKHLTNLIKMVAYQVESDLFQTIRPWYRRAEQEGRTLIQSMLASAGDLTVSKTELRVRIAPLSSAHRTRVLQALCKELNQTNALFPGTRLRICYAVRQVESAKKRTI